MNTAQLTQKAISAALAANWELAANLNKLLVKENKEDIDALNRLARAYVELGDTKRAKAAAKKVLKIDPTNPIANKSLSRWEFLSSKDKPSSDQLSGHLFLEEPGKTKLVTLIHLGSYNNISKLDSGNEVLLASHGHRVSVCATDGTYIGRLPDDISARVRKLMSMGNVYQTLIKSVDSNGVSVFIRETKRANKLTNIPSFSAEKVDYISFTKIAHQT